MGVKPPDSPDCPRDSGHDSRAIFLTWVPAIPFVAIIATVLLYIAPSGLLPGLGLWLGWARMNPLLGGLAAAALIWALLAGLAWAFRLTASSHANARSYSDLCQRLQALHAKLAALGESISSGDTSPLSVSSPPSLVSRALTDNQREAWQEVTSLCEVIRSGLGRPGLSWVMGTGYINLWIHVHRAEEALIEVDLKENVIAGAIHDRMRISSSQIDADSQKQMIADVMQAVTVIDPSAVPYLWTQPVLGAGSPPTIVAHILDNPPMRVTMPGAIGGVASDAQARAALRQVRFGINEFRDGLWDGLVRTRNHLLIALTLSGIVTYLMLTLAVGSQLVPRQQSINYATDPIVAATAFYLVGAIVGLFNVLNTNADAQTSVDDYGLTVARLVLTPVSSGLAALLGVFLVALLPATFNGQVLSPSPTNTSTAAITGTPGPSTTAVTQGLGRLSFTVNLAASGQVAAPAREPAIFAQASPSAVPSPTAPTPTSGSGTPPPLQTLDNIYNLSTNRFGLVIAAAFGLTPGLLISAIKRVPDQYKAALQSTESTSRKA